MKVTAFEEHHATHEVTAAWTALLPNVQDMAPEHYGQELIGGKLPDFAENRVLEHG